MVFYAGEENQPVETIAQAHLFVVSTFLLQPSQPKDPDFLREESTSTEEVGLRNGLIYLDLVGGTLRFH